MNEAQNVRLERNTGRLPKDQQGGGRCSHLCGALLPPCDTVGGWTALRYMSNFATEISYQRMPELTPEGGFGGNIVNHSLKSLGHGEKKCKGSLCVPF